MTNPMDYPSAEDFTLLTDYGGTHELAEALAAADLPNSQDVLPNKSTMTFIQGGVQVNTKEI